MFPAATVSGRMLAMQMRRNMQGITLIELMIVVVIIAIITSVAFPNYRAFIIRSQRAEAKAAVLKAAVNQEKWYLTRNQFSTDLATLGFKSPFKTESGKYLLSISASSPTSDFTVTATYQGTDVEKDKCKTFSIDSRGNKTSAPYTDCWTRRY